MFIAKCKCRAVEFRIKAGESKVWTQKQTEGFLLAQARCATTFVCGCGGPVEIQTADTKVIGAKTS